MADPMLWRNVHRPNYRRYNQHDALNQPFAGMRVDFEMPPEETPPTKIPCVK
jgi:hypothetical protein